MALPRNLFRISGRPDPASKFPSGSAVRIPWSLCDLAMILAGLDRSSGAVPRVVDSSGASPRENPEVRRRSQQALRARPRRWRGAADDQPRPRLFRLHARRPGENHVVPDNRRLARHGAHLRGGASADGTGPDSQGTRSWSGVAVASVGRSRQPGPTRRPDATNLDARVRTAATAGS